MDVEAYLARIGFRGDGPPDAANLAALVKAHRTSVPYETIDLWCGRRTTLEADALFDKIVTRRRGGYCFELNGLFAELLRELGYEVREYAGRWLRNNPTLPVPRRCHRVVCVRTGKGPAKIVETGVALPGLAAPLDVVWDRPQLQDGRFYRLVRDERLGNVVETMDPGGRWTRLFSFDAAPAEPIDFEYPHWWCQTHPDSVFHDGFRVFRLCAEGGWKSIECVQPFAASALRATLVRADRDGVERRSPLEGQAALAAALADEFGISGALPADLI